jgi:hypothetical protein
MPLTWTSNGRIWLALHGDQWAMIQEIEESKHPFLVIVGYLMNDIGGEIKIDTTCWNVAGKFKTLEQAQAWAEEKLGVEK